MPISRVDLPGITAALRDLYGIVENPTPTGRSLEVFLWDEARYTPSYPSVDPASLRPEPFIRAGIMWVMDKLTPSGRIVWTPQACEDITASDLDFNHKRA